MFQSLTANQLGPVVDEVFGFLESKDIEGLNTRLAKIRDEITVINMHYVAMYLRASYNYRNLLNSWEDLLLTAVRESVKNGYLADSLFYGLWKRDNPVFEELFKGMKWVQNTRERNAQS
jgi:hypothetical protein